MGFELAFKTDGFEGDVEMIEDTWCRDEGPQEDDADSVHTAVRLGRKAIPPTKLSPKLGKLARSNPSVPSKSPWYLSRLPLTSELTFSTMVEAVFGSREQWETMQLTTADSLPITWLNIINTSSEGKY